MVVTIVGLSRLLDGPLLWIVAVLLFAATALGMRQVLAEGAPGYASVPLEASILPAVFAAGMVGAVRLVPVGVGLIPAIAIAWLALDLAARLEARVFDRPSGTTPEDRTALLIAGLAAAFMSFAGAASLVAGGLADPAATSRTPISEAGIVAIAIADGAIAALIGYRLATAVPASVSLTMTVPAAVNDIITITKGDAFAIARGTLCAVKSRCAAGRCAAGRRASASSARSATVFRNSG